MHFVVAGPGAPTPIEAAAGPDDVAAWAAAVTPGAAVVTPLAAVNPARLSQAGRVDVLAAIDKQLAWLQALQLQVLADADAHPYPDTVPGDLDKDWIRDDIAAALRLSSCGASDRLALARALTRLPGTMGLLRTGQISLQHARTVADAVTGLTDPQTATVEAAVLDAAPAQTVATLRRALRRAVLTVTEEQERRDQARTERRVVFTPVADGMTELWALLPAEGAAALKARLDDIARRRDTADPHTADQRRADALVDLALGASGGSLRPTVQVTVALSTLLAVDDQPGVLDGHGPIPASLARRIAADPSGTWRRLVTDPYGRLLDYGRTSYRPPADLDDYVRARDATCRFPGCNRPARRSELDHIRAWADGGVTSEQNLQAVCTRHHKLKHETPWQVRRNPDTGTTAWTSPTGHHYTKPPDPLPIDHTVDRTIDTTPEPPDDPDPPYSGSARTAATSGSHHPVPAIRERAIRATLATRKQGPYSLVQIGLQ